MSIAVSLAVIELFLRSLLLTSLAPNLGKSLVGVIADPGTDDGYRLRLSLQTQLGELPDTAFTLFDPVLGRLARTPDSANPLGLAEAQPYDLTELRARPAMLFFGDSFTEGFTDYPDKLPQLLDRTLSGVRVLNFGVMGDGLDQMYLRMTRWVSLFDRPHMVFGILFEDLDRVTFQVRDSPKPFFELDMGHLRLRGVPLPSNPQTWSTAYPARKRLYIPALIRGIANRGLKTHWAYEFAFPLTPGERRSQRAEKQRLVTAFVEAIKTLAQEHGSRLTFVLIPQPEHITHRNWREEFMTELLAREKVDYINLREPLLQHLKQRRLKWWRDVYRLNDHPTPEENRLFAGYIARCLQQRYGYPIATAPTVSLSRLSCQ